MSTNSTAPSESPTSTAPFVRGSEHGTSVSDWQIKKNYAHCLLFQFVYYYLFI
jgi:hypothetical protein